RLWVNGNLLIDKWVPQAETEWCFNAPANVVSTWVGTGGAYLDATVLPVTGAYTILIDPRGFDIGSMTVTLYNVPPDVTSTITPGAPATAVEIGTPGQNAAFTFSGTAGDRVTLRASGVSIPSTDVTIIRNPVALPLTAGQLYSIQMEYFQGIHGAIAKLRWS